MRIIIIFLLSCFTFAENVDSKLDLKVRYEYDVYLEVLNLKLGKASLALKNSTIIDGVEVYHLVFNVKTNKLGDRIYKIRNKVEVWIDRKNLNVVKQTKSIKELRKKKEYNTVIRNQKGITNGKEFIVNKNVFDPYSLILILSKFDIPVNQSKEFNIVDAGKNRIIEIKNLGFEKIKTSFGIKEGYTLSPINNGQRILKNKGDMEITYIELNQVLVPAEILIKLSNGVIQLKLQKIL